MSIFAKDTPCDSCLVVENTVSDKRMLQKRTFWPHELYAQVELQQRTFRLFTCRSFSEVAERKQGSTALALSRTCCINPPMVLAHKLRRIKPSHDQLSILSFNARIHLRKSPNSLKVANTPHPDIIPDGDRKAWLSSSSP